MGSDITILVIEDDPAVRRGIVDVLEYAGYRTLEAPDGHHGMDLALKANYRLLLLDLVMPGPSGFEILQALKISKSDRHTASGNAYTTALVFLKLKKKLGL